MTKAENRDERENINRRSLFSRLIILAAVFVVVPVVLYARFQAADSERNDLLIEVIEKQGDAIAAALAPAVVSRGKADILAVSATLKELGQRARANVRLLLNPSDSENGGFFFVAAWPPVDGELLEQERRALVETVELEGVKRSCGIGGSDARRYINARGEQELITSLDTIKTEDGCWVVITSYSSGSIFESSLARRYWAAPEVQIAIIVYLLMAAVTIWLFVDIWLNVKRFEQSAVDHMRGRGGERSFQERNRFKELDRIAKTFDNMVAALQRSAETIRRSAEENAHAFKAPIAVMRQSVDPLRRAVGNLPEAERRPVEIIDASLDKLDGLVSSARELDIDTADSLENTAQRIELMPVIDNIVDDYMSMANAADVKISTAGAKEIKVIADPELLESALENVIENAVGFSPPEGTIRIFVDSRNRRVRIVISDEGPGIPDDKLEQVFERYMSIRDNAAAADGKSSHFGIGLFVVRRNIELMGGDIRMVNRHAGGLDVAISLPEAP